MTKGDTTMEKSTKANYGAWQNYQQPQVQGISESSGAVSPAYTAPAYTAPAYTAPAVLGASAGMYPTMPAQGQSQMFPANVMPAQVSPTQNFVKENVFEHIVPHVHPSHTTTVNKHVYNHQHYFPHTESCVEECFNQQTICGPGPVMPAFNQCCGPRRRFGF